MTENIPVVAGRLVFFFLPLAVGKKCDNSPEVHTHGGMMVHVQKGNVTELLPHYEEHRVRILQQLGQVVDPNCTRMLKKKTN